MKKKMIQGICVLTAALFLGQPVNLKAAEINDTDKQQEDTENMELLTAGIGDIFYSKLTETEYKEIARRAEGALWGYTHLGICNVEENNLNIRQAPEESGKLVGKLPKNAACIAAVRINTNMDLSSFEISFLKDSEKPRCVSTELQFSV